MAEDADKSLILFKSPSVELGSRIGAQQKNNVQFPSADSKKAVAEAQIGLVATEANPDGPYWYYTLAVFPRGIILDNRIMADNDKEVAKSESMPDAYKDDEADENVIQWHSQWLIAIKGSGKKENTEQKESLKDRKQKARKKATV